MKYSFMTFSTPDLAFGEIVDLAASIGYDGVEIRIDAKHKHGIEIDLSSEKRKNAKRAAAAKNVDIGCIATSCRFADPETTERNIADAHSAIDLAADLDSKRIRVFGGKLAEGLDRAAAVGFVAEALGALASHAAERGVFVCMETHDDWCDPTDVAEVMKRVDQWHIAVNWDILHPVRTGNATIDESFRALGPWIRHVHVHDQDVPNGDLAPIGTGFVDHRRAVELLHSIDYDGFVSGEWINWSDPYESHLPRELATLKRYESEIRG